MQFVYPAFLFGLFALAIPIIIHLFSFRRFKRVYFSNVRFLREVKEQTTTRHRLKHILVLISRCLAILFLVFAFAQPFIPAAQSAIIRGVRSVSIYIDNSFSMEAQGKNLSLLENAKEEAAKVALAYNPQDQFQLLTNDFKGEHQRLVSRDEFLNMIGDVEISPAVRTLNEVHNRQGQLLETAENPVSYLLSDFQKAISDLAPDSTLRTWLVKIDAEAVQNLSVDTAWMDAPLQIPGETYQLFVRLTNHGESDVEQGQITLTINDQLKSPGEFTIPAHETIMDTMTFTVATPGWNKGKISITDFPVSFDDDYYFTFKAIEKLNILVINEGVSDPKFTKLGNRPFLAINQQNVAGLSYSEFPQYQLILLNEVKAISSGLADELTNYVDGGGSLLVFPGAGADITGYNRLLSQSGAGKYGTLQSGRKEVGRIITEQGFFTDVFEDIPRNISLPVTFQHYPIQGNATLQTILAYNDGSAFFATARSGSGNVFLTSSAPSPEFSDLGSHSLFVVMVVRAALAAGNERPIAYTIGRKNAIEVINPAASSDRSFIIKSDQEEFIPQKRAIGKTALLFLQDDAGLEQRPASAGHFDLLLPESDFQEVLAFNYDRRESEMAYLTTAELQDQYGNAGYEIIDANEADLGQVIAGKDNDRELWKLCLILALIFLATEIALLRLLP